MGAVKSQPYNPAIEVGGLAFVLGRGAGKTRQALTFALETAVALGSSRFVCGDEEFVATVVDHFRALNIAGLRVGFVGRTVTLAYSDPLA